MVKQIWKALKTTLQREANRIMDRKVKKLTKELVKLDDAQVKEILEFLQEEADEEVVEEVTEVKEEKQEPVVKQPEPQETKTEAVALTKKELEELLTQFASKFVTKEEIESVKEEVDKAQKKAKPFGVDTKVPKEDKVQETKIGDLLAKVNSQFV